MSSDISADLSADASADALAIISCSLSLTVLSSWSRQNTCNTWTRARALLAVDPKCPPSPPYCWDKVRNGKNTEHACWVKGQSSTDRSPSFQAFLPSITSNNTLHGSQGKKSTGTWKWKGRAVICQGGPTVRKYEMCVVVVIGWWCRDTR